MPTDKVAMPVTVTIIIMCLYIFGGAALFSYWEDWDFPSSVYFTWVIKYLKFIIVECVEIFRIKLGLSFPIFHFQERKIVKIFIF